MCQMPTFSQQRVMHDAGFGSSRVVCRELGPTTRKRVSAYRPDGAGYPRHYSMDRFCCWLEIKDDWKTVDTLQKTMNRWLEELPRLFLADLLDQKLRAQGIKLSKLKRGELADKILKEKLNAFDFDHGRKSGAKRNITIEFTDTDSELMEKKFRQFMDRLPALIDSLTENTSQSILSTLKRRWPSESRAQRHDLDGFRKRLQQRWGVGLEKLRMLITIAREYGSDIGNAVETTGGGNASKTFEILFKLHARSCQIAEEIVCL